MDKQIEEMTKDLQEAWTAWSLSKDLKTPYAFVAEILAKKWQPKIPEGAVVLTEEEYEKIYEQAEATVLSNIADGGTSCHWCMNKHEEIGYKKGSKETVEKFAERLTKLYTGLTPVEEATGYTSIKELLEMINAVAKEITEGEV